MTRKRKLTLAAAAIAISAAAAAAAMASFGAAPSATQKPILAAPRPVRTHLIAFRPNQEKLLLAGTVESRIESPQAFRTGGKLVARLVDVGARVEPGQVLARLDPADLDLNLRATEAQLAGAEADLIKAKSDLARYAGLAATPAYSPQVHDQRRAAFEMAQARADQLKNQLRLAQNQRDYGELRAEVSGIVTQVKGEIGQIVAAGQTVLVVARTDQLEIAVSVPENKIGMLAEAGDAEATLWTDGERRYRVKLREIAATADPATRTYIVRYSVLEPDAKLQLGMSASLRLQWTKPGRFAEVPLSALTQSQSKPALWQVDPQTGTLTLRPVELAGYGADTALVSAGIDEGAVIVSAGVGQLDASLRVRVDGRPVQTAGRAQ